jgi:hypothetical protein
VSTVVTATTAESPAAPEKRERKWLPTLIVATIVLFVVFGGYLVAGALSTKTGEPVVIGDAVTVHPLSGWELANRGPVTGGGEFAELTRGTGSLDVVTTSTSLSPEDLLRTYVEEFLKPNADQLSVSQQIDQIQLDNGMSAVRASYVGTFGDRHSQIEGEVTALVTPSGQGVVFDGWGPAGLYPYAQGDIDTMIRAAEVQ